MRSLTRVQGPVPLFLNSCKKKDPFIASLPHTEPSFRTSFLPPLAGFIPVVKSLLLLLPLPTDVREETGFEYLIRGFTGSLTIISSARPAPLPGPLASIPSLPSAMHTTVGFPAFLLTTGEKSPDSVSLTRPAENGYPLLSGNH